MSNSRRTLKAFDTMACATAALVIALVPFLASPRPTLASSVETPEGCSATADTDVIVLDCRPGFATDHDVIRVYPRDGVHPDRPLAGQIRDDDAVWVFDAGATGGASLVIDFHTDDDGRPIAEVYDDGDGDGVVGLEMRDGIPSATDNGGRWTVHVTSRDGAWRVGGRTSYSLDMLVDGPVRATFNSSAWHTSLQNDGTADFAIHVRDRDDDGRPDYEWRQFYPPLPEDPALSGHYRTEIVANPEDDEIPVSNELGWPYLAQRQVLYPLEFVKPYGSSPAPIEVDWERARVVQIGEFVASRGNPGSYFIYSITRVAEGRTNTTNFENPFAFYDLAGAGDGWPDMTIRFEANLAGESSEARNPTPINIVEYTWDQQHEHQWSYAVNLVGHDEIDRTIDFPEFAVRAIPPDELPGWVTGREWDAATFVELTKPYWTTEHVYEYTVEEGGKVLPLRYLTGLDATPPTEVFERIPEGMRGEYAFHLDAQPRVYLSPVDRRPHLSGAEGGVWNVGDGSQVRYRSALGSGIDTWTRVAAGGLSTTSFFGADQAILLTPEGVSIGSASLPDRVLVPPPIDRESWESLRDTVDAAEEAGIVDDPVDQFARLATSTITLEGASISGLRASGNGFRFELTLTSVPKGVVWLADGPGRYAVTFDRSRGYVAEPLRILPLEVSQIQLLPTDASASTLATIPLSVRVTNPGNGDIGGSMVSVTASHDGRAAVDVGSASIDVPAGGEVVADLLWQPSAAGTWTLTAAVSGATPSRSTVTVIDRAATNEAVVAAQDLGLGLLLPALVLAAVAVLAAALVHGRTGTRTRAP